MYDPVPSMKPSKLFKPVTLSDLQEPGVTVFGRKNNLIPVRLQKVESVQSLKSLEVQPEGYDEPKQGKRLWGDLTNAILNDDSKLANVK